jgi:CHAT domain-containing protein
MAGAADALDEKTRGNIPEGVDDGVLTAREIAQLDLRTLDLVVLSACETGLGDVSGDGVFGLQRGFKKAGAKTLLMSLWKVDDHATQLLMTEFYRNLTAGQSKRQAFIAAQQHLRQCEGGKYDKPEFWAAFILLDATE